MTGDFGTARWWRLVDRAVARLEFTPYCYNAGPERGDRERTQMAISEDATIPVMRVPMKPPIA